MIVETLSVLGAISLGASLGVYIVASEATLNSLKPWKQRTGSRSDQNRASVVLGGIPWRTGDGMPEAFCGLCDQALDGVAAARASSSDVRVMLSCRPCGLAYPLTEGMTFSQVVSRADERLSRVSVLARQSSAN